ncbi:hypothetical protein SARC_02780 [Sphaeroforma arctica JP610]|uniref:Uncharacterized protein n=1 Tax=Sphaeroforma arctica JP610 TaxID=667725 RepID=A0A0L0G810_9EUKA|nr:hypothetical protein SARC_02780 [Sphaeroforma arctica JP610]KNC85026.1 hypothetical protein SARC_02780 [Sphaeroforma arctica JP610]|eukprot:XP_014158928.1 hypothetical protein SARC_02780 [Sphaeroforma arctica JP610]
MGRCQEKLEVEAVEREVLARAQAVSRGEEYVLVNSKKPKATEPFPKKYRSDLQQMVSDDITIKWQAVLPNLKAMYAKENRSLPEDFQ